MRINEVTANLIKKQDPESGESEIGSDFHGEFTRKEKTVIMPMNQIKSRFEGDDKADLNWIEARANIERIKKQIKKDPSKLPAILVRRLPKENTY